jgi:hypothetical protein
MALVFGFISYSQKITAVTNQANTAKEFTTDQYVENFDNDKINYSWAQAPDRSIQNNAYQVSSTKNGQGY